MEWEVLTEVGLEEGGEECACDRGVAVGVWKGDWEGV